MNLQKIIVGFVIILFSNRVSATHVAGGDISYTHISGDSFLVKMKLYEDCSGSASLSTTSETVRFTSSCGNFNLAFPFIQKTEISQLCPAQIGNSTCNGGPYPGMLEYIYERIVVLPACSDWNIYYTVSNRNTSTNIPSSSSFQYYVNTTLNNVLAPQNNSPEYSAQPIPYVCQGQPVSYSWGIVEIDGDSLKFELVCPKSGLTSAAPFASYAVGYSCTNPIPGITIDPLTGLMNFTPLVVGKFIVAVQVTEYDDFGNVIGTAVRDIQFVVEPCSNNVPDDTAGIVQNLLPPANTTGPYNIQLCEGDTLSFDAVYTDSDTIDILTITTNIATVLPGATYSVSGTNPLYVHYEWIVPGGTAGSNSDFLVTVNDGSCPIPGLQFFIYNISIIEATVAGIDQIICGPSTEIPGQAYISVSGGTNFQWTSISGDPIIVGVNFSCDTCTNVIATPSVTTTYVVTSNLSSSCKTSDTITVFVVPDYSFSTTQSDTGVCLFDEVSFLTTPSPNIPGYTYDWNCTGCTFDNTTISNPLATFINDGLNQISLTITSPDGCVKRDTFYVNVSPNIKPDIHIFGDSTLCYGDSTLLTAINNNGTGCMFILNMVDLFGDGWNGAQLEFVVDGTVISSHTISTGSSKIDTVILNTNSNVSINFTSGTWPSEEVYSILDGDGNVLHLAGPFPANGVGIWSGFFACAQSGLTFSWLPGISSTLDSVWVNPLVNTTYTVIGVDPIGGCTDTAQFSVYVVPNFNIIATASDDSICLFDQVQFNVTTDSLFIFNYSWFPSSQLNNDTITNPLGTFIYPGLNEIVVEVSSALGCEKYDTIQVFVSNNATPDVIISGDSTICMGDSVLLISSNVNQGGCTFIIEMNDNFGDGWNGAELEFVVDGVIASTHTISSGSQKIDTIIVTSGTNISINFSSGSFPGEESYIIYDGFGNILFSDGPTPINGTNIWSGVFGCTSQPLNYIWIPSPGLTTTVGDSVWVFPTSNTTYTVIGTDPIGGCFDTGYFNVMVVPSFSINATASNDSICLFDQVQFSVGADSAFTYSYSWIPQSIMNDAFIQNPVGTFNNSGLQTVVVEVESAEGCSKFDTLLIAVSTNIVPSLQIIGDSTICEGDSVLLLVNNLNDKGCTFIIEMNDSWGDGWNGGANIQFQVNGTTISTHNVPSGGSQNIDTVSATGNNVISFLYTSGSFNFENSFIIYDGFGNVLYTSGFGPTSGIKWTDTVNCNTVALDYTWSPSTYLSSNNSDSIWIKPLTSIAYTLIGVDPIGGCSDTTQFNMLVVPTYSIQITSSDDTICKGELVQFNVSSDSAFTFSYTWSPSGVMDNDFIQNPTGTFITPGNNEISVMVSSGLGCDKYDTINVFVSNNFPPDIQILGDSLICEGDSAFLLVSNSKSSNCFIVLERIDNWPDGWNGAELEVLVNGVLYGTYSVAFDVEIDTIFLASGDNVSINFSSGSFPAEEEYYIYDASGNLLFSDGPNPTNGNSIWNYTMNCSDNSFDYVWTPLGTITNPTSEQTWVTPNLTTTYTVITTDPIGKCADTANFIVNVIPQPIVEILTTDTVFCLNEDSIYLSAQPTPGIWSGIGITLEGSFLPSALGMGPKPYVYSHFNGACSGSDTILVYIFAPPQPPIPSANNPYCKGYPINDISVVTNFGTVDWYRDSLLSIPVNINGIIANDYSLWVTETDYLGCTSNPAELQIVTTYTPNVAFISDFDSASMEAPVTINFENQSSPFAANYAWYINNEFVTNSSYNLTYNFEEGGIYTISLVGTNPSEGCKDSATLELFIYQLLVLDVPNVFSPNGDGMNDIFYVKSKGLQDITLSIYNRWGKLVYGPCGPVDDPLECAWDGEDHPEGTYYYIITAKDRNGKAIKRDDFNGHVTLLRSK